MIRTYRNGKPIAFSVLAACLVGFPTMSWAQEVEPRRTEVVDTSGGLPVDATAEREAYRVIKLRPKKAEPIAQSRLFPSRSDLRPGNAAPILLRQNFEATAAIKLRIDFRNANPGPLERTLDDPKIVEVEKMQLYRIGELERAAYRERAGWEYPLYEPEYEESGIHVLLPDVQESRNWSLYLSELARSSIAQGRPERAEYYLRVGLGLTKQMEETPFLVVKLVETAQVSFFQFALEELVQHPEAQNYYWDLAHLPRPFIDTRTALEWESGILTQTFPQLKNLDVVRDESEWQSLYENIVTGMMNFDGSIPKLGTREFDKLKADWAAKAQEQLPRLDPKQASRVKTMSDAECSIRYWWLRAQPIQNKMFAAAMLEPHLSIEKLIALENQAKEMLKGEEFLLNTILSVNAVQIRAIAVKEQKFALLRTIEAIRHFAAEHAGRLPQTLPELSLPAPLDPLSGQPFEYQRSSDGRTAELRGKFIQLAGDKVKQGFTYRLERAD